MRFYSLAAPLLAAVVLLAPPACAQAKAPNPADCPLTVHVLWSTTQSDPSPIVGAIISQRLRVTIDSKQFELSSCTGGGILAPGDNPAQSIPVPRIPKNHAAYDLYNAYRPLLPDGKTRDFGVVGMGTAP